MKTLSKIFLLTILGFGGMLFFSEEGEMVKEKRGLTQDKSMVKFENPKKEEATELALIDVKP